MTAINMLAPTLAVHNLELVPPRVFLVAMLFIVTGIPLSVWFRQQRYNRYLLNIISMLPLLLLTWALVRDDPGLHVDWSDPIASAMTVGPAEAAAALLHILLLLAAGRAFVLVTARDLSQSPIPGITIFLLTAATTTPSHLNAFFYLCLLLLFISSLYLLSQDHSQRWFSIHTPWRIQRRIVGWAVLVSLLIFPPALLFGNALRSFNMQGLAARQRRGSGMGSWHLPSLFSRRYLFSVDDTIEMGALGWTEGSQVMMTVTVDDRPGASTLLWRAATYPTYADGRWHLDVTPYTRQQQQYVDLNPSATTIRFVAIDPTDADISDPGIVEALREGRLTLNRQGTGYLFNRQETTVEQDFALSAQVSDNGLPVYGAFQMWKAFCTHDVSFINGAEYRKDGSFTTHIDTSGLRLRMLRYQVRSIIKPSPGALRLTENIPLAESESPIDLQLPGEIPNSKELKQRVQRYQQAQRDGRFRTPDDYKFWSAPASSTAGLIWKKAKAILQEGKRQDRSDLEKVQQFALYLAKNYEYTLQPAPPPAQQDPIVDFLYNQKQGYCVYFSGAMVMLCRSVGIPARMVSGFATGEAQDAHPAGKQLFQVKADDAHAWAEVYLPRYGWYTIDPTAGSTRAESGWAKTWDKIVSTYTAVKAAIVGFIAALKTDPRARLNLLLGTLGVLLVFAGVVYLRRDRPPAFPRRPLSAEEATRSVLASYRCMHTWLRHWGVIKPGGLTATEFDQLFREVNPRLGTMVGEISACYIRVRYGAGGATDAEARRAIQLLHDMWQLARTERRHLHAQEADV